MPTQNDDDIPNETIKNWRPHRKEQAIKILTMDSFIRKIYVTTTPKKLMIKISEIIDQKELFFLHIANNFMLAQMSTNKGIKKCGKT